MEWKLRKGKVRKNKKKVNDRLGEMKGKRKKAINRAKLLINLRSVNDDVRNWFTPLSNYPAKLFLCGGRAPVTPLRTINDLTFISRFLPLPPPAPWYIAGPQSGPFTSFVFARSNRRKNMFSRGRLLRPPCPPPFDVNPQLSLALALTPLSTNGLHSYRAPKRMKIATTLAFSERIDRRAVLQRKLKDERETTLVGSLPQ